MAQINLQVYRHIGQELLQLEGIARQVGTCVLERVVEKRNKPLTDEENKQILRLYQKNASQMIKESKESISKLKESPELGSKELVYSEEEDERRFQCFLKVLENILSKKMRPKITMLPSWNEIKERTGNYFALREMLRRRSNQSTWSRLRECQLIG